MTNVVHTEEIVIKSVAGGYLEIEPFCIPNLDCRVIGYLVYHSCETGAIHSFTDEPICHVVQHESDTCVCLDCWELNPKQEHSQVEFCWIDDPCTRLYELRCCQMKWLKEGKKKDWSWRDSSGSYSYLSEQCLKEMISEAEIQCEAQSEFGVNSRCLTYRCRNGC